MHLPWLVCTVCRSFFTIFWFSFPLLLALLRDWALLNGGLCFSLAHPFSVTSFAILLYHSYREIVCLNPAGPLWVCNLFFSQWPNIAIGSFITSPTGSCVPFVFPQASWARLLSLGFPSPFLNFVFSQAFTKFFGLPKPNYIIPHPQGSWVCHQPLTFFFSLLWVCCGLFSLFHIIYCP